MCYIFEHIDRQSSRKRVIYYRLKSAVNHAWRFKRLPRIQRDANNVWR